MSEKEYKGIKYDIPDTECTCKHAPIPIGASIEKYLCPDCGGIAVGWYWPELSMR